MTPTFRTIELAAQPILGIRTETSVKWIARVMGSLFAEVYKYIAQQGQKPAGMPLARYHSPLGAIIDLECAMPVAAPLPGRGRIQAGELPAGTTATVTHMGPYEELQGTWLALTGWVQSEGLTAAGPPWEVYVTDPGTEPDKSKWRTDIFFPVRRFGQPSQGDSHVR